MAMQKGVMANQTTMSLDERCLQERFGMFLTSEAIEVTSFWKNRGFSEDFNKTKKFSRPNKSYKIRSTSERRKWDFWLHSCSATYIATQTYKLHQTYDMNRVLRLSEKMKDIIVPVEINGFTQLRRAETSPGVRVGARARIESRIQSATSKNRRLAMQMARRPAVIAALNHRRGRGMPRNIAGSAVTQGAARFGRTNSIRGSFRSLRGRGTQRLGRMSRSQSLQSLSALSGRIGGGLPTSLGGRIGGSFQSLTGGRIAGGMVRGRGTIRGRGRGRIFRSSSVGRFNNNRFDNNTIRRGTGNFRGRGGRGGSGPFRRGAGMGRGRGRGGRALGRGARGGMDKPRVPNKETLDKELDQYMSASRVALDKEIDQYMNEPEENWD